MSQYGQPFSAKWINSIAVDAYERLELIADEVVDALLKDGYPPLTQPVTLADLKVLPVSEVAALLEGMVSDPSQAAAGTKLASDYSQWYIAQQMAVFPSQEVNALPKQLEREMAQKRANEIGAQIGVKA